MGKLPGNTVFIKGSLKRPKHLFRLLKTHTQKNLGKKAKVFKFWSE